MRILARYARWQHLGCGRQQINGGATPYALSRCYAFDISDSRWHIGLDGVKKMAFAYPNTPLILWHWGSVDAPEWKEFNGDPEVVKSMIKNPERVVVLAPGEGYCLNRQ